MNGGVGMVVDTMVCWYVRAWKCEFFKTFYSKSNLMLIYHNRQYHNYGRALMKNST